MPCSAARWHLKSQLSRLSWTCPQQSSGMSSFFTDEGLSERCCLPKHSFADCLHPLQGSSEGSKNLGRLRRWWVNESFLPILEVILNKTILLWEVERNLMVPVCLGSLCPEDAHIQRVAESYFSRPSLTCLCHNTVGSCKGKPHRPVPNLWEQPAASRDTIPKAPFIHQNFILKIKERKFEEI